MEEDGQEEVRRNGETHFSRHLLSGEAPTPLPLSPMTGEQGLSTEQESEA